MLSGVFLDYALRKGENWSGDFLVARTDDVENHSHQKSMSRGSSPKKYKPPPFRDILCSQVLTEQYNKKDTSYLDSIAINFDKKNHDAGGDSNADSTLPRKFQSVVRAATEDKDDFWSIQGEYVHLPSRCTSRSGVFFSIFGTDPSEVFGRQSADTDKFGQFGGKPH